MPLFSEISQNYTHFLCDLWGVIHDGDALYPGVLEALEQLYNNGKKLVFLSNAPRSADSVTKRMDAMRVKREWYVGAVTSGEGAVHYLQGTEIPLPPWGGVGERAARLGGGCGSVQESLPPTKSSAEDLTPPQGGSGSSYYYLGLEQDEAILREIPQQRVKRIEEANFLLNGNFEYLGQPLEEIIDLLRQAAQRKLPMLCINPDLEVIKLSGQKILCAGYLAQEYEQMGGKVDYVGKPYPLVFKMGMEMLGNPPKDKVLMIGDNVLTDIKGANDFGMDSAFVTQGIVQNQLTTGQTAEEYCQKAGVQPSYIIEGL